MDEVGGEVKELAGTGFVVYDGQLARRWLTTGRASSSSPSSGKAAAAGEQIETKIEPSPSRDSPWGTNKGTRRGKRGGGVGRGRGSFGDARWSRAGDLRRGGTQQGTFGAQGRRARETTRECGLCREFAEGIFIKVPLRHVFRDGGSTY